MNRGRPRSSNRRFVEDCTPAIDVRQLTLPSPDEPQQIGLDLTWPDGRRTAQTISLSTTRTGIGALRRWLICPLCRRRTAKLYAGWDRKLGCRICRSLVYRSQYLKSAEAKFARRMIRWQNASPASRKRWCRKLETAVLSGRLGVDAMLRIIAFEADLPAGISDR